MNDALTVFTSVTDSYAYSDELQLCMTLLQEALPDAHWIIHRPDMAIDARRLLQQNLPDSGWVLLLKEPAILMDKRIYPALKQHLTAATDISIVLPDDVRHLPRDLPADYHTLRGFEQYSAAFAQHLPAERIPYDGREPWAFLLTAQTLNKLDLPADPFALPQSVPAHRVAIAQNVYTHPFINYYHETRDDILPFVPTATRSLLDIGCARGGFAASVKQALQCKVSGIEMNRHEAAQAVKVLDKVRVGDVLSMTVDEQFDCISCLDVLEHIPVPQQLLQAIKPWLLPQGKVLLNVPNVGFWAIVEDLLAGRWDYVPTGILCNTHLRFYTQHSLRNLLQQCGYRVLRVEHHRAPIPERVRTGFERYRETGLTVAYDNLDTVAFTVLAELAT